MTSNVQLATGVARLSDGIGASEVPAAEPLTLVQIYKRALGLLAPEKYLAIGLAAAGVVIAATQLAEPVLFGRVVDTLSKGENAFGYIGLWAFLGLFGIVAGVIVGINADRLAHRQKQAHLVSVFEKTIGLPQRLHAARGSGATIRTILSGTSALFWLWLGAMRDQISALFGILLLIPTAIGMDPRMAAILLALATAYTLMNVFVMRKTAAGQAAVESHEFGALEPRRRCYWERDDRAELRATAARGGRLTSNFYRPAVGAISRCDLVGRAYRHAALGCNPDNGRDLQRRRDTRRPRRTLCR